MASYRLSDRALADLDRLYEHGIHDFGLRQADEYYDGLIARFQAIVDRPLQWRRFDEVSEVLRRSVFGSHSIYYLIDADDIARPAAYRSTAEVQISLFSSLDGQR